MKEHIKALIEEYERQAKELDSKIENAKTNIEKSMAIGSRITIMNSIYDLQKLLVTCLTLDMKKWQEVREFELSKITQP